MTGEPDDYDIPLEGYEAALGNDLSALQARIKELEAERDALAEKLEKLERWQAAAFIAHGNLDLDIEANPEALAELKGQGDE